MCSPTDVEKEDDAMEQKTKKSLSRFGSAWERLAETVRITPKSKKEHNTKRSKEEKIGFFAACMQFMKKPLLYGAVAMAGIGGGTYLYKSISMPKVHVEKVAKNWMKGAAGEKKVHKNQRKVAYKKKSHKHPHSIAYKKKHHGKYASAKKSGKKYHGKSSKLAKHSKKSNKARIAYNKKRNKGQTVAKNHKSKRHNAKKQYASYAKD